MTTKIIFTSVAIAASAVAACTDADIGVNMDPVTCLPQSAGEIHGGVDGPNGYHHDFAGVTVQYFPDQSTGGGMVQLNDNELFLDLTFGCGAAQRGASYSVIGSLDQRQLDCPDQIYGSLTGQIEILPVDSGLVLVDEGAPNSNCVAGRFHVDFGGDGDLVGWFSAPL